MGVAVEDITCAAQVYMRARRQQLGTWLGLY
jgi:ornithine cyclodeaminase/alanine dehydrogenase-like protein (mu-crystallin family)